MQIPVKKKSKNIRNTTSGVKPKEAKKKIKTNQKSRRSHSIDSSWCLKTEKHYRLNLGDIPFVVGKVRVLYFSNLKII